MADFATCGWMRFGFDPDLALWAAFANQDSLRAEASAPADMIRCGGTWYVGVNALNNDPSGRLPGGPALSGAVIETAMGIVGHEVALDLAQASVCYPGYPRHGAEESEAAYRYRRDRMAAHLDGLHRMMPGRRRMLKERHAFILGIPLCDAPEGAAPLVVWEGSNEVMRAAFRDALQDMSPDDWPEVDLTEPYQAARRRCFETCRAIEVSARPGEAYLIHRLALHGVAPWRSAMTGRRAIAYFRPDPGARGVAGQGADWWLAAD